MATFIHIADERRAAAIRRSGLKAARYDLQPGLPVAGELPLPAKAVFCVPVVPNYQFTLQWLRALKIMARTTSCAVQFRLGDQEPVLVGHYREWPKAMTAAEAVGLFLSSSDPRGMQVLVPRSVEAREVQRIRAVPQLVGWRYYPDAHGRPRRWPESGSINAARTRNRMGRLDYR